MQSVTSNAVAVANSYSTSETFTGKYWIDGKKIYKKTYYNLNIEITNPNRWYLIMPYPSVIDTITDYITIAITKQAFQNSLIYIQNGNLAILSSQSWSLGTLTLEYTKTTD